MWIVRCSCSIVREVGDIGGTPAQVSLITTAWCCCRDNSGDNWRWYWWIGETWEKGVTKDWSSDWGHWWMMDVRAELDGWAAKQSMPSMISSRVETSVTSVNEWWNDGESRGGVVNPTNENRPALLLDDKLSDNHHHPTTKNQVKEACLQGSMPPSISALSPREEENVKEVLGMRCRAACRPYLQGILIPIQFSC